MSCLRNVGPREYRADLGLFAAAGTLVAGCAILPDDGNYASEIGFSNLIA